MENYGCMLGGRGLRKDSGAKETDFPLDWTIATIGCSTTADS